MDYILDETGARILSEDDDNMLAESSGSSPLSPLLFQVTTTTQ